jgi:glycerophosphoryl diester phosphodiesterase
MDRSTNHRPLVLGHRGASHAEPENTIAAFATARTMGADGVELDARRTRDDVLVVHHDAEVDGFGLIRDHDDAQLRASFPALPTLADALDACAGMLVNVEIKCLPWDPDPDTSEHAVVRAVVELVAGRSGIIVSSFSLDAVDAARSFAPELTTAWLTMGQTLGDAAVRAAAHGHAWCNPDRESALRASAADIAAAHDAGVKVNVWTVDDPDEIRHLAANGVDAIITNEPDRALAALAE